jgi:two-component system CheB/CheR fusion protein
MDESNRCPALRVLVADDCGDSRTSLAMLLRLWGFDPIQAADGEEAVEAARTFLPAIVLLDVAMPRLDGLAAAQLIRRVRGMETALLVAISGYGREEDVRLAREAGFDQSLLKPYDIDELMHILARVRTAVPCPGERSQG